MNADLRRSSAVNGQFLIVAGDDAKAEIDELNVAAIVHEEIFKFDISVYLFEES